MSDHNIASVEHLSPEPDGGYLPSSPVKVTYIGGSVATSQWGSDEGDGGVLAWRAQYGDEAAATYQARPISVEQVIAERERRLALGFDYNFGDARGTHRIGTTKKDLEGWDEVSKIAQAAINLGAPTTEIAIVSDTGPVTVTALEWQMILAAAGAHRQPIWAASFALQAMSPIPLDYVNDGYWV